MGTLFTIGQDPELDALCEGIASRSGVPVASVIQAALLLYDVLLERKQEGFDIRLERDGKLYSFNPETVLMNENGVERLWPLLPSLV
jgi:hypothetical protein